MMSWCLLKRLLPHSQMHRTLPQRRDECAPSAPLVRPPRRRGAVELCRCPRGACKRWREPGEEPFKQIESILRPPWGEFESSPFCPTQLWPPPLVSCCDCVCHWHCLHIGLCILYSAFFNCACNLVQNRNEKCHEPTRSAHNYKTSFIIICLVGWPLFTVVLKGGEVKKLPVFVSMPVFANVDKSWMVPPVAGESAR